MSELIEIIRALASTGPERQTAETIFDQQWSSNPQVLPALLQVLENQEVEVSFRTLAAVLFRRSLSKVIASSTGTTENARPLNLWRLLDPAESEKCKSRLLYVFSHPSHSATLSLRLKIADSLAEMARLVLPLEESWPQLTSILGESSQDPQMVLRVLGDVPELLRPLDGKQLSYLFERFLLHSLDPKVRVAALKAFELIVDDMIDEGGQDERLKPLGSLILQLNSILSPVISCDDNSLKTDALNALTELVITCPKFFRDISVSLINALVPLVADMENNEEEVRSAAMEVILSLIEELPSGVRKNKALIAQLCQLGFNLVGEVEDDPEWYEYDPDSTDPADIDPIGVLGEQAVDRMSVALGGKAVFEYLFMHLIAPALSTSNRGDWKPIYAALKCIASGAEGCQDVLEDKLKDLLDLVWPCFGPNNHPRVHFAACHALGQLCTDFSGILQGSFCSQSLGALLQVLQSSKVNCVQQHAAAALVNFAEGVDQSVVAPFLNDLINTLVRLLQESNGKPALQQQLIATIAAFSSVAGEYFANHYETVAGLLLPCLSAVTGNESLPSEMRMLQVRAVEAISLFAHSVGKARFAASKSGQVFLKQLVQLTECKFNADDWKDFLPAAWVRVSQVLQDDFAPFAQLVLGKLRESAVQEADLALLDADAPYDPNDYPEEDWDFVVRGGRRLGIRTSGLEDKLEATTSLVGIVQSVPLNASLLKDLHDLVFLPLLPFDFHESVQASAAEGLLAIATRGGYPGLDIVEDCKAMMLNSLKFYSGEFATSVVDALTSLIEQHLLDLNSLPQLTTWLENLSKKLYRELKSDERHSHEQIDEGDGEDHNEYGENEDVVYAFTRLVAVIGRPLGPTLSHLVEFACKCSQLPTTRHAGLCLLAELIKQGNVDINSGEAMIRKIIERSILRSNDSDIQQVGCYAVGLGVVNATNWHPWLYALTRHILSFISTSSSLSDNAVACIARMLEAVNYQNDFLTAVWPQWIAGFPVFSDLEEVPSCYQTLLKVLSINPSLASRISPDILKIPFAKITDEGVLQQLEFLKQFIREHNL